MARPRFIAALSVAASLALGHGTSAAAADSDLPTVIELFQSQGCSSCPPANANLNAIGGRPDVLALSFAVTYWDRLGWKDIFARPAESRCRSPFRRRPDRAYRSAVLVQQERGSAIITARRL